MEGLIPLRYVIPPVSLIILAIEKTVQMRILKFALLLLAVAFTSCESDTQTAAPPPSGQPLLLRVAGIDTTLAPPFDTVERYTYTYDNLKRPVRTEYNETDASGNSTYASSMSFFYNGTDTLAFKSQRVRPSSSNTRYHFFDNGRLIMDSSGGVAVSGNVYYAITRYTYSANTILEESNGVDSMGSNGSSVRRVYQTLDANNNVLHQIDTLITFQNGIPVFSSRNEHIATYHSALNPMAKFSDPIRRPYLWDDFGVGSEMAAPRQLFSSIRYLYKPLQPLGNNSEHRHDYTFEFRNDGLLSVLRMLTDQGHHLKYIFFYE